MLNCSSSRRSFLATSTASAFSFTIVPRHVLGGQGQTPPSERVNIAGIGCGGMGGGDIATLTKLGANYVALCDVDENRLNAAGGQHSAAKKYFDYRELLEQKDLDAVVVATPDFHHAPATVRALRRGLHVYCEKPLTHTVEEARLITKLAAEKNVATQMGTQNHEHPGYVRLVELIQSGAIGNIREAHIITDRPGRWWSATGRCPTSPCRRR